MPPNTWIFIVHKERSVPTWGKMPPNTWTSNMHKEGSMKTCGRMLLLERLCAATVSLLLGRIGLWSGREIAHSGLSLAHSAQAERDNELCFYQLSLSRQCNERKGQSYRETLVEGVMLGPQRKHALPLAPNVGTASTEVVFVLQQSQRKDV
ncbi:hypothetical protein EVAR_5220_1 [Eumeta japonica]|uniref:Uncharacterized protein n=1 Tax=Eumeta variegata TaxID=151549 RepID=A0A4C1V4V2_EUMVA|nr:hypothetical protein EVAR_5220_1 [Eumeta japonica]